MARPAPRRVSNPKRTPNHGPTVWEAPSFTAGRRSPSVPHVDPPIDPSAARHVYQLYTVLFDETVDRNTVIDTMAERDLASRGYWDLPIHRTTYYQQTERSRTPTSLDVTEDLASRVLSLPIHPNLGPREIDRVVAGVREDGGCGVTTTRGGDQERGTRRPRPLAR